MKKIGKDEKICSMEDYRKTFYPSESKDVGPKSSAPRQFGISLAKEILDQYRKLHPTKGPTSDTSSENNDNVKR